MEKFDINPQEILWGDNVEKEGGASAFMMGEEEEETKVWKEWEREGGGAGGELVGVDGGSTGDHDKQTEETLLADNADVEEE